MPLDHNDPAREPELSVDELIAQSLEQINSAPGEAVFSPEELYRTEEAPRQQDLPQQQWSQPEPQADFMPDFGDAFDDYGEYHPQGELPLGAYEPGGYDDAQDELDGEDDMLPPPRPKRRHTRRIVPLFVKILLYLVIVGVAAVGLGYGIWECAQDVMAFGRSDEELTVTVGKTDTVDTIADMLKEKGVIKYPWLFRLYCDFTDSNEKMDPGTYVISYNFDYHALVSGMRETSTLRTTVRVTIPEGRTAEQIFALMEKNGVCTAQELADCAANTEFDYWFLEGIPYGAENRLEGFLFPDTYDFYEGDDPERVINKLLSNFNKKFTEEAQQRLAVLNEELAARLRSNGFSEAYITEHALTVYDLITVASMIEKESAGASESNLVAEVIYNRLCNANFPCLQIDATVVYALGGVEGGVSYEDTLVESPYNTYLVTGLPAGPIANPGRDSITAALYPTNNGYYYYALDKSTGYHHFSRTYDEHNRFLQEQNNEN